MKPIVQVILLVAVVAVCTGCPPVHCAGTNPRATEIQYSLLSTTSESSGTVRIVGVVTNWGISPFESAEGQQTVLLYEGDKLVARQDFVDIPVDGTVEAVYEREWDPADESRPEVYMVIVVYYPEVFTDGSPSNDDCEMNDNWFVRNTAGLDALF